VFDLRQFLDFNKRNKAEYKANHAKGHCDYAKYFHKNYSTVTDFAKFLG
jgi:hypothetical protein